MPIEFEVLVEGLCAERENYRVIKTDIKEFGKVIETSTTNKEEVGEGTEDEGGKYETKNSSAKTSTQKRKNTESVWILPEDEEELKQFILDQTEWCLASAITNDIRGRNARKPITNGGTLGLSRLMWNNHRVVKITVSDIEVVGVKKNQVVQRHGIIGKKSSILSYADTITFKAKTVLESPIESYGYGTKLLKTVLEYLNRNCFIGAFHNSGNGKVTISAIVVQ